MFGYFQLTYFSLTISCFQFDNIGVLEQSRKDRIMVVSQLKIFSIVQRPLNLRPKQKQKTNRLL